MKKKTIKLSRLEVNVMGPFWAKSELTVREAAEALSETKNDPGYSVVQTIAGRLEKKGALERTSKVGKAWLFQASIAKGSVVGRMMEELLAVLDGASNPILSHLVESDKIGESELEEIRKMVADKKLKRKDPQ